MSDLIIDSRLENISKATFESPLTDPDIRRLLGSADRNHRVRAETVQDIQDMTGREIQEMRHRLAAEQERINLEGIAIDTLFRTIGDALK